MKCQRPGCESEATVIIRRGVQSTVSGKDYRCETSDEQWCETHSPVGIGKQMRNHFDAMYEQYEANFTTQRDQAIRLAEESLRIMRDMGRK